MEMEKRNDTVIILMKAKLGRLQQDATNLKGDIAQYEQALAQMRANLIATEGAITVTNQYLKEITGELVDLQEKESDVLTKNQDEMDALAKGKGDVPKPPTPPVK